MKCVLDASAALCWVIPRPLTPKAVRLRDDCRRTIGVSSRFVETVLNVPFSLFLLAGVPAATGRKGIPFGTVPFSFARGQAFSRAGRP